MPKVSLIPPVKHSTKRPEELIIHQKVIPLISDHSGYGIVFASVTHEEFTGIYALQSLKNQKHVKTGSKFWEILKNSEHKYRLHFAPQ